MRALRNGKILGNKDDDDEVAVSVMPAAPAPSMAEQLQGFVPVVDAMAQYTAPDFSLPFLAFFALLTYCHETYYVPTLVVIAAWMALQMASVALTDDFHINLFWNLFALLGNLVFYLFVGCCWSYCKLYLDTWLGHMPAEMMERIRTAQADSVLADMKWTIIHWIITWPASLVYTFSRDPLRIFTEMLYEWSKQHYITIISAALQRHDQAGAGAPVTWTTMGGWLLYVFAYGLVGYAWTHAKLFIDVWQGALPPSLEAQIREVYERKASYWEFVQRIKWLVFQWMVTWPFSIVYTLLRHPCRMLADAIYTLSQRKYVWIVRKAMEVRHAKKE